MIRLDRAAVPLALDPVTRQTLTDEYKNSGAAVWNEDFIKHDLLTSSNFKCAYCEVKIDEESKYMEVEHFRCKTHFPDLVVEWDNLLPSCKRCNGKKHAYNVDTEGMIINPFDETPSQHLFFQNYRLRWRNELGRRSIDILYLNDSDRVVAVRMKIGEKIAHALEIIRSHLELYIAGPQTTRRRNQVTRGLEKLLHQAQPSSEFSALAATVLISDQDYVWIRDELINLGLWAPLEPLAATAELVALLP